MQIHIYETYKNTVIPHRRHIYAKAYDMEKATMCEYSHSHHALLHWKRVLIGCAKCPSINLPDQETYDKYPNTSTSTRFHIYHLIAPCTIHGRHPLTENKSCRKCQHDNVSGQSTKIYTRRELVITETNFSHFHSSFIFQQSRIWPFTFHTYKYLVQITVATLSEMR